MDLLRWSIQWETQAAPIVVEDEDSLDAPVDCFRLLVAAFILMVPFDGTNCFRDRLPVCTIEPVSGTEAKYPFVDANCRRCLRDPTGEGRALCEKVVGCFVNGVKKEGERRPRRDGDLLLSVSLGAYRPSVLREFLVYACSREIAREVLRFGRPAAIISIGEKFFQGTWPHERKVEEEAFLRKTNVSKMLGNMHFELSGISVARDSIVEILQFYGYGFYLLYRVAPVSSAWYILIMSTWTGPVRIVRSNFLLIPTVILRNATSFVISTGKSVSVDGEEFGRRFNAAELKTIFRKLLCGVECPAMTSLAIAHTDMKDSIRRMALFQSLLAANDTMGGRLRSLDLGPVRDRWKSRNAPNLDWPCVDLKSLTPNLEELVYPGHFKMCVGLRRLRVLKVQLLGCHENVPVPDETQECLMRLSCLSITLFQGNASLCGMIGKALHGFSRFHFVSPSPANWNAIAESRKSFDLLERPLDRLVFFSISVHCRWRPDPLKSLPTMPNLRECSIQTEPEFQMRMLEMIRDCHAHQLKLLDLTSQIYPENYEGKTKELTLARARIAGVPIKYCADLFCATGLLILRVDKCRAKLRMAGSEFSRVVRFKDTNKIAVGDPAPKIDQLYVLYYLVHFSPMLESVVADIPCRTVSHYQNWLLLAAHRTSRTLEVDSMKFDESSRTATSRVVIEYRLPKKESEVIVVD